ncbi:PEP-CTERM sorting domain-containing protein [Pirellulales bacterium]|nr:PEP-CTERM sorting domain-containing protein [Pirellulales bacterium]
MDLRISSRHSDRRPARWLMAIGLLPVAALLTAMLFALPADAQTASGTIDFGSDPGFTITDDAPFDGNEPPPTNVPIVIDIDTTDSVMFLTMTRDQGIEKVVLPIGQNFDGNGNNFKARVRFAVMDSEGNGADVLTGFFSSEEFNTGDDSQTGPVIEDPEAGDYPARNMGGEPAGGFAGDLTIDLNTWYVYDFEFQPDPETQRLDFLQGDGTTLIESLTSGATSGMTRINEVGFGNVDRAHSADTLTVAIDFMTWAVNTTLPTQPAFATDASIAPPPPEPLRPWQAGSGDWTADANWDDGPAANDNTTTAVFSSTEHPIDAPLTVFTDADVTVEGVQFNTGVTIVVGGTGSINLESAGGDASLTALFGTHQFQAVVNLNDNTNADIGSSGIIEFNNSLNLNGHDLTNTGAGTLAVNNELNTGGGMVNLTAGAVSGSGEINGDVVNSGGTLAPGNSPGVMTINGDYTQLADGALEIEIGGLSRGDEHDALIVNGQTDLDGVLEVLLVDGFSPEAGDAFDVLDLDGAEGGFAEIILPELTGGLAWNTSALASAGVLSVAIPEPASAALLLLAAGSMTLTGRRKSRVDAPRQAYRLSPATVVLALLLSLLTTSKRAAAESGVIDFFSDPNLTIVDPAGNLGFDVDTTQGVLRLVMHRQDDRQRVFLPLSTDYVGNENRFRGRVRFAVRDSAPGNDVNAGFFASDESNVGDTGSDSATLAVIEGLDSANWPARFFGGQYDRGNEDVEAATFYVYEFDFQAVMPGGGEIAELTLFEGDGTTITTNGAISGGGTSGISHLDQIGFGNIDGFANGTSNDVVIDFMTWSVNEPLPPDPTFCSGPFCISPAPVPVRTWKGASSGDWNSLSNWDGDGGPPNDNGATAVFGSPEFPIAAPLTAYNNEDLTVEGIRFDTVNKVAITGLGSLTLESDDGLPNVGAVQGTHEFQVNVTLAENAGVDVSAGAAIEFDNRLALGGNSLAKTGGGILLVNNKQNTGAGALQVDGGVLGGNGTVGGGVSNNATVAPGASLGTLGVEDDYSQGSTGVLAIEIAGTANGEFDLLEIGGTATLDGLLDISLLSFTPSTNDSFTVLTASSIIDNGLALSGQDAGFTFSIVGGAELVLNFASPGGADINGDGFVDGADFLIHQRTDSSGIAIWEPAYGMAAATAAADVIPEPTTWLLWCTALAALPAARRRRS